MSAKCQKRTFGDDNLWKSRSTSGPLLIRGDLDKGAGGGVADALASQSELWPLHTAESYVEEFPRPDVTLAVLQP
jgi:hypothetical protein